MAKCGNAFREERAEPVLVCTLACLESMIEGDPETCSEPNFEGLQMPG